MFSILHSKNDICRYADLFSSSFKINTDYVIKVTCESDSILFYNYQIKIMFCYNARSKNSTAIRQDEHS